MLRGARGDIAAVHRDGLDAWASLAATKGLQSVVEPCPHSLPLVLRSRERLVSCSSHMLRFCGLVSIFFAELFDKRCSQQLHDAFIKVPLPCFALSLSFSFSVFFPYSSASLGRRQRLWVSSNWCGAVLLSGPISLFVRKSATLGRSLYTKIYLEI